MYTRIIYSNKIMICISKHNTITMNYQIVAVIRIIFITNSTPSSIGVCGNGKSRTICGGNQIQYIKWCSISHLARVQPHGPDRSGNTGLEVRCGAVLFFVPSDMDTVLLPSAVLVHPPIPRPVDIEVFVQCLRVGRGLHLPFARLAASGCHEYHEPKQNRMDMQGAHGPVEMGDRGKGRSRNGQRTKWAIRKRQRFVPALIGGCFGRG